MPIVLPHRSYVSLHILYPFIRPSHIQTFLFGDAIPDYEDTHAGDLSEAELSRWRRLDPLDKLYNIRYWIMGSAQRIQK